MAEAILFLHNAIQDLTGWDKPQLLGSVMPMQAWSRRSPSELSSLRSE